MQLLHDLATPKPPSAILLLVLAIGLKHLVADYFLQSGWMACGKAAPRGWLLPLLTHAGIHGLLTTAIALAVAPGWWWLGVVDLLVHAGLDRVKATVVCHRWQPSQSPYWWAFGIDQEAHALTHLAFIAVLVSAL